MSSRNSQLERFQTIMRPVRRRDGRIRPQQPWGIKNRRHGYGHRPEINSLFVTSTPSTLSGGGEGVVWSVVADNTGLLVLDEISDADLLLLLPLLLAGSPSLLRLGRAPSLARCTRLLLFIASSLRRRSAQSTPSNPLLPPCRGEGLPPCSSAQNLQEGLLGALLKQRIP